MGSFSIWHWLVVLVVVLVLFGGGGKLSRLMGDMARGITAFKKGLKENDAADSADDAKAIEGNTAKAEAAVRPPESAKKDETAKG